ncbi:RNA 3'-terminal phosphate cyclase [Ralstonia pseudosolanacearum]|uniref:RNA 3'-terminal phosphate cyclase n=1 Tax=Ralstonia pseudosolanacearum TaxID=1310165 RepID=UPI001C8B8AE3|nr:RNA 3'-terminal phosphate cyclase [Ralstonia pseudosolanacearum]MBX9431897.1 RNA 3'-terminal phosphate cyclase [Ralstonia pseudosolanacearum]
MNNRLQPAPCIELDGAQGEGGGQILRTALTLSMLTGTPFRIERIRAGRSKPGLMRQHLTAVQAAAEVSGATVEGAEAGSQALAFAPGPIHGGDYRFAIGTAGSCTLVLQTVLPALWFADAPSTVAVSGGTHNRAAPPVDFLIRAWQPLLARMGVTQTLALKRHGFYPAGGGEVLATVTPCAGRLGALHLTERGALRELSGQGIVANVRPGVARRELEALAARVPGVVGSVRELSPAEGPGNALVLDAVHEHVTEVFTGFGERGVPAEQVAHGVASAALRYLHSTAAVDEYLADQLVLPMALAGAGCFTAVTTSPHLTTNIAVIEKFLPVEITVQAERDASVVRVLVN